MSERVSIQEERCIACGLCERLFPHLFRVVEHRVAVPLQAFVFADQAEEAREAAMACPTEAIAVVEQGKVYFVGAGPGDPELITVKGQRILQQADVILYTDSLVNPELMRGSKPNAEILGSSALSLSEIVRVLVEGARAGKLVARVHTGDPAIYGAIFEQIAMLRQEGIPYEIVPGVSAVFGAAAALGVELTVPELAQTVILSRAAGRTPVPELEQLQGLAAHQCTLVLYLSVTLIRKAVADLLAGGYPPETPVAVVQRATWPDQRVIRGTLADIAEQVRAAGIHKQALILVGKALDPELVTASEQYRSRLYDQGFTHAYRRAAPGLGEG